MKGLPFLLAAAIGLASCSAESASTDTNAAGTVDLVENGATATVQTIGSQQTKTLLEQDKNVVILDVRTPGEYASGHLKNAQHIDFYAADFSQRLQSLDPATSYVVYCAVGGRSREAVQLMAGMGFQQVYDSSEGYSSLKSTGVPVE